MSALCLASCNFTWSKIDEHLHNDLPKKRGKAHIILVTPVATPLQYVVETLKEETVNVNQIST